jgi:hypothetical protein
MERRLSLRFLKKVGVSPVTFLNWAERCETLLVEFIRDLGEGQFVVNQ